MMLLAGACLATVSTKAKNAEQKQAVSEGADTSVDPTRLATVQAVHALTSRHAALPTDNKLQ
jgi:hypothetical protein